MEKLKHLKNTELGDLQKYMSHVSLKNTRLEFQYRVLMLDTRADMGKRYSSVVLPGNRTVLSRTASIG